MAAVESTTPAEQSARGFSSTDGLLLALTLIWGANYALIKYSLDDFIPLNFVALRLTIATIMLVGATIISGRGLKVVRRDLPNLIIIGVLANVIYPILFILGMKLSRAGNASLILATSPLFTALIGKARKTEIFSTRGAIGLLIGFAGLGLIVTGGHTHAEGSESLLGDALLLLSAFCWGAYTGTTRDLAHRYGALKSTALLMLTGTPLLILFCIPSFIHQNWQAIRVPSWATLLFSAVFAIGLAYMIWSHGIRKIGSTRTAVYSNLTPIATLIAAWFILGEVPLPGQILGTVVILTGLYMVRSGVRHREPVLPVTQEPAVESANSVDFTA